MAAADDPDLDLVRALQAGQERALGELMGRHQGGVFRFLLRNLPNATDAADLTQETFVRAYFRVHQFRPGARFSVWLYRIALNSLRDHARSRSTRQAKRTVTLGDDHIPERWRDQPSQPPGTGTDPAAALEAEEERREVERAIAELPADLKEAFTLVVLEGHSQKESGAVLGASPKAVETRVYRARKLLAKKLRAIWP